MTLLYENSVLFNESTITERKDIMHVEVRSSSGVSLVPLETVLLSDRKVFLEDMGELWVEHNLSDKILFGSGSPRIRPVRSRRGLDSLGFSEETRERIYYRNARRFLGSKEY